MITDLGRWLGPVVRINFDEAHIYDLDSLESVFNQTNGRVDKPPQVAGAFGPYPAVSWAHLCGFNTAETNEGLCLIRQPRSSNNWLRQYHSLDHWNCVSWASSPTPERLKPILFEKVHQWSRSGDVEAHPHSVWATQPDMQRKPACEYEIHFCRGYSRHNKRLLLWPRAGQCLQIRLCSKGFWRRWFVLESQLNKYPYPMGNAFYLFSAGTACLPWLRMQRLMVSRTDWTVFSRLPWQIFWSLDVYVLSNYNVALSYQVQGLSRQVEEIRNRKEMIQKVETKRTIFHELLDSKLPVGSSHLIVSVMKHSV